LVCTNRKYAHIAYNLEEGGGVGALVDHHERKQASQSGDEFFVVKFSWLPWLFVVDLLWFGGRLA